MQYREEPGHYAVAYILISENTPYCGPPYSSIQILIGTPYRLGGRFGDWQSLLRLEAW